LQQLGAHNINFVSPSHMVPQVLISLLSAARRGLRLPLVYNSNGYDSLDSLRLLDGVIDIYLPDLKYGMDEPGITYSGIVKYAETAQTALREMHRQVGLLQTDSEGIARKGLIIRHLVMPRNISRTYEVLKFIAEELSPETAVSIMAQYYPANRAKDFPEIDRPLTADEYDGVYEIAESLGLVNGWFQSQESERVYRPDFQRRQVFSREELKE